jgi:tRNA pseudouridine55 synthase
MFADLLACHTGADAHHLLHNGNPLVPAQLKESPDPETDSRIRVYDTDGQFCGIYQWSDQKNVYRPEKMFLE